VPIVIASLKILPSSVQEGLGAIDLCKSPNTYSIEDESNKIFLFAAFFDMLRKVELISRSSVMRNTPNKKHARDENCTGFLRSEIRLISL
jgi:hypothetical protein